MKERLIRILEFLGGARQIPLTSWRKAVLLALWWATLLLIVYATIGRTTRFIYVDF